MSCLKIFTTMGVSGILTIPRLMSPPFDPPTGSAQIVRYFYKRKHQVLQHSGTPSTPLRGPVRRSVHGTSASEEALGRTFHNIRRLVIIRRVSGKNSAHGVVGFDEDAGRRCVLGSLTQRNSEIYNYADTILCRRYARYAAWHGVV